MRTAILALCLAASAATAQQGVTATISPRPVALTVPVSNRFCNQTGGEIRLTSSAPWAIKTLQGGPVFSPIGLPVIQPVPDLQCRTFTWNQRDDNGQPVPPALYLWEVYWQDMNGRNQTTGTCFEVTTASVILCSSPATWPAGCPIRMTFSSPGEPGFAYYGASSLGSSPGIALTNCRTIPLNVDPLLLLSLCGPPPVFNNYCGVLSAQGTAPVDLIPPGTPALAGVDVFTSFVTVTPANQLSSIAMATRTPLDVPGSPCPCP